MSIADKLIYISALQKHQKVLERRWQKLKCYEWAHATILIPITFLPLATKVSKQWSIKESEFPLETHAEGSLNTYASENRNFVSKLSLFFYFIS